MRCNPATAAVPKSGRFSRETPEMTEWVGQCTGWRILGCPGEAPTPPDLTRAIEVWQDGRLEGYDAIQVYDYDMRGIDLSEQPEALVAHYLGKRPSVYLWPLLNCTLPGETQPAYNWADIHVELHRSITRLLGVSRGEANQHVMDALDELLEPTAKSIANALTSLIIRKSGPCSAPEIE